MASTQKALAKDVRRYHEDEVQAAHTVPVAVTFRLYEKLSSAGAGGFKARAKNAANSTEPFWMYLFQECWDKSIRLTHEIYVDAQGCYNHVDCHEGLDTDQRPEGMDVCRSLVLCSSHYQDDVRRAYLYHVLLSPFQMPQSRLDAIIPGGRIAKGDSGKYSRFLAWSKDRELNRICFTTTEEKRGATRCLWAPWMKAWALADQCGDALYDYQKCVLDQADRLQIASYALSLSSVTKLDDHVSMDNIKALLNERERTIKRLAQASEPAAEYVQRAPFTEMLADVDADDSEDAMAATLPYLSDVFRVLPPEVLAKLVNPRYFDFKFSFNSLDTFKVVRRSAKALWEVNLMFAKALAAQKVPPAILSRFVDGVKWWSRKIFGREIKWENGRFNPQDLKAMETAAKRAPFYLSFVLGLDVYNAFIAIKKLRSPSSTSRDAIAAIGAISSAVSGVAKVTESLVTDPKRLQSVREVAAQGLTKLEPAEEALLRSWASSGAAQKLGAAARNTVLKGTLGFIGGAVDAIVAFDDLRTAFAVGDSGAGVCLGLIVVGGLLLAAGAALSVTLSPVSLAVLATFGQSLELAGLLGSSFLQSSDLELWLRFCCFGRKAADNDANIVRSWTDGHTLSKVAQSTRLQIECFGHIVYHMDVSARRIDYERLDPLMEIAVSFAYCLPSNGQLFLRVEVLQADGSARVVRPLSAWSNATKRRASDKKTVIGLSDCFKAEEVLLGVTSITVSLKLQADQSADAFYPEDKFVVKTFEVAKLSHS